MKIVACLALALAALLLGIVALTSPGASASSISQFYPDLRTVVPTHLNLVNSQQRDILRFSNGIANTGRGPWAMRALHDLGSTDQTTTAIQEIRTTNDLYRCGTQPKQVTACHEVVFEKPASVFEYHPTHHHWHTGKAALFEVRRGSATGPIAAGNSAKAGFCLIEVYRLEGNSKTSERAFWECNGTHQGAGSGWVDQYHQATDGQTVDLTGLPDADNYYLVSTADPDNLFLEADDTNNTAWIRFALSPDDKGNRKVTPMEHSSCATPGLCGVGAPNRG